jgi:hypothetical protein
MAEGVYYLNRVVEEPEPHILVRPEPHSLTAVGAIKRCGSGAKPDVQNRTLKKKQVLRSHIILMRPVLRSRITFMLPRLRVKILMRLRRLRLRLLPYCIVRQNLKMN